MSMLGLGHAVMGIEPALIREVERFPVLYDKDTPRFNRTRKREEAWREIEDTIGVSESECKKRWRSLRDSFIKLQRTRGVRKCRWPYVQQMQFLLPHIDIRIDDSEPDDEMKIKLQPEVMLTVHNSPINVNPDDDDQPLKKPRHEANDEMSCIYCQRPSHPDDMFLLSCSPILQRLTPKQNALARIQIQKLLFDIEFEKTEKQLLAERKEPKEKNKKKG